MQWYLGQFLRAQAGPGQFLGLNFGLGLGLGLFGFGIFYLYFMQMTYFHGQNG